MSVLGVCGEEGWGGGKGLDDLREMRRRFEAESFLRLESVCL